MVKIKNYECTICAKPLDWDELIDGDFCTKCFEDENLYELPATELIDLFYSIRNSLLKEAGENIPEYSEEEYYALMDLAPSEIIEEINKMNESKKPSNIIKYIDVETFEGDS